MEHLLWEAFLVLPTVDVIAGEALATVNRSQPATLPAGIAVVERIEQGILTLVADELEILQEIQPVFRAIHGGEMLEPLARVRGALAAILDRVIQQELALLLQESAALVPGPAARTVGELATLARDLIYVSQEGTTETAVHSARSD
jgi:hypothetical protein